MEGRSKRESGTEWTKFKYACRQGIRWWEVDIAFYVLRLLAWVGIVRNLRGIRSGELEEVRAV